MKKYFFLVLFAMSCFMYGVYSISVIENIKPVKTHQWVLTGFFGLFFLGLAVNEFEKNGK